jgi:hypothetical protein
MKSALAVLVFAMITRVVAVAEDDGGFHSISEFRAVDPMMVAHIEQENIDDLFDTWDVAKRLANEKRVRLFRRPADREDLGMVYFDLERKPALGTRLGHDLPVIEVPEKGFRSVLKLAADFDNYGDGTMCGFKPGVALLLGDQPEPDLILICCFQCHDIHIVRRPTTEHPMTRVAEVGMSPALERAIFALAQASCPADKELQSFHLENRKRSKTPVTREFFEPSPRDLLNPDYAMESGETAGEAPGAED